MVESSYAIVVQLSMVSLGNTLETQSIVFFGFLLFFLGFCSWGYLRQPKPRPFWPWDPTTPSPPPLPGSLSDRLSKSIDILASRLGKSIGVLASKAIDFLWPSIKFSFLCFALWLVIRILRHMWNTPIFDF